MVKQPGFFSPVICGIGIGSAEEREKCGIEDVQVVFNLPFFLFWLNFGQKTRECC